MRGRVATRPLAERVRLVDDQQRARSAGELAQPVVKPGLRQHDADVRQRRLGQHASDVTVLEFPLESHEVVPLDDAGRLRQWNRRANVPLSRDDRAPVEAGESLVDGAVVAPVEDEDLRPAGQLAGEPDRESIGVRRRQRELPARKSETARQLLTHPERVLARQHQGDSMGGLLRHSAHGRLRRVPGHRACVPEAEVDVLVPVDVAEAGALSIGGKHGKAARPTDHPRHRDAGE